MHRGRCDHDWYGTPGRNRARQHAIALMFLFGLCKQCSASWIITHWISGHLGRDAEKGAKREKEPQHELWLLPLPIASQPRRVGPSNCPIRSCLFCETFFIVQPDMYHVRGMSRQDGPAACTSVATLLHRANAAAVNLLCTTPGRAIGRHTHLVPFFAMRSRW
jgi:hypothetical protein